MSNSNCCFLTCIQISQEAGKVVWCSYLFKNFPQFVVIHTVKCFSIANEAEVNVFLEFPWFFYDPADVGNLISDGFPCGSAGKESACNLGHLGSIPGLGRSPGDGKGYPLQYSGLENSMDTPWSCKESDRTEWLSLFISSAFSKSGLNIWKFLVHVLWRPSLENFEHYFTNMRDECNCVVTWTFFGIAFLWDWNENWPFPVLWAAEFSIFAGILSAALQQHHVLGFEIAQLKFHHLH